MLKFDLGVKSWLHLYNKRRYVCLSVSMFRMAGQTAGPIETKLDTRTHVHPGSVCQGQCQGHSCMRAGGMCLLLENVGGCVHAGRPEVYKYLL